MTNRFLMINLISAVFMILVLFSLRMILANKNITAIEVNSPISCYDFCEECEDISVFHVDTVLFGKSIINDIEIRILDAVSDLTRSDNPFQGLVFNLKSASYNDYIELLDAIVRNGISKYKLHNDYVYLFPKNEPKQIEFYQTCFVNSTYLNLIDI